MATKNHNLSEYDINSVPDAKGMTFGIVVAEWNENITAALLEGAKSTLIKHGVDQDDINVMTVPGSFELIYGLITTLDMEQAQDRAGGKMGNKGDECAITAIKMVDFRRKIEG